MLLATAATSCGDEDGDAKRLDGMATDVWIDQVAEAVDSPEFCNDPEREDRLPDLLIEQYGIAAEDLDAVADLLRVRCEAGG